MHNAMRVREGTVTITGSHPHSRWSFCAQGHRILSQYQASYPAILDIATSLSLNKLFGYISIRGVPHDTCRQDQFRLASWRARGRRARLPRHPLCTTARRPASLSPAAEAAGLGWCARCLHLWPGAHAGGQRDQHTDGAEPARGAARTASTSTSGHQQPTTHGGQCWSGCTAGPLSSARAPCRSTTAPGWPHGGMWSWSHSTTGSASSASCAARGSAGTRSTPPATRAFSIRSPRWSGYGTRSAASAAIRRT